VEFVEDISETMEVEGMTADMPCDHPVRVNFMRLLNQLSKLFFEAWMTLAKTCKKHRESLRTQYLLACEYHRVTPSALQTMTRIIQNRFSDTLDLSRHGLTKHAMSSIIEALTASGHHQQEQGLDLNFVRKRLGYTPVAVFDVFQNDLQGVGCEILVKGLLLPTSVWCLTTLRIGDNNIRDQGCLSLVPLLSSDRIRLQHLSVQKNQIGDKAIAQLMESLIDNNQLLSLDISQNRAEIAAGTGAGVMLQENRTLTSLDCSSNMIRGKGALLFAEGLGENDGLVELNLAWNGFGDQAPCGAIGVAMEHCNTLQTLNIGYNRINIRGATMMASHLEKNGTIRSLIMDGNPIGMGGIRLLMQAAKKAGNANDFPPELSLHNCDKASGLKNTFNPAEPAGEYEIDMADGFSAGILKSLLRFHATGRGFFPPLDEQRAISMDQLKLKARPPPNAMLGGDRYTLMLPSYDGKDDDGNACRVVNPDESEWKIPTAGLLRFKFASVRVRDTVSDMLEKTSYLQLKEAFADRKMHHQDREKAIDLYIGTDTVVEFEQVQSLLEHLGRNMADKELTQTRGCFVAKCYHKLKESVKAPDSLDLLDPEARLTAEKRLGMASLQFTRNNPTGHYKLRLEHEVEREICLRLIECRGEQTKRLAQMEVRVCVCV